MATKSRADLERRVTGLQEQYEQDQAALNEVRELLAQADQRRKKEPGNTRKWDRVLENLEKCLDEVKVRLNSREISLREAEKELSALPESPLDEASPPPGEAAGQPDTPAARPTEPVALARAIASCELSAVEQFTLEEVALVTGQLGETITPENFPDYERLQAHLEYANQRRSAQETPPESPERRRQLMLRTAIDKLINLQFEAMSKEEMTLVLASHELMLRNLRPTDRDQRLKAKIEKGVAVVKRRLKAMP